MFHESRHNAHWLTMHCVWESRSSDHPGCSKAGAMALLLHSAAGLTEAAVVAAVAAVVAAWALNC